MSAEKKRAPRNRTLTLNSGEKSLLAKRIFLPSAEKLSLTDLKDRVIRGTVPDHVFWKRNTLAEQARSGKKNGLK